MIEIQELRKVYARGDTEIAGLDDVSLRVERGEIAAVVGPSGAGKSSLARCINMLERPTSGRVVLDGKDLTALRERHRRERLYGPGHTRVRDDHPAGRYRRA